jgi:creatinine amidohydrolase
VPVILPLGSTEQHGPHLPLATDTTVVQALADRTADQAGVLSLPACPYGAPSRPRLGGGPEFPMGAEVPLGAYYATVTGLVGNLLRRGIVNLVVISWHAENAATIYDAARVAWAPDAGVRVVCVDSPADLVSEASLRAIFGTDLPGWNFEHAGLVETAIMLALQPKAVRPFDDVRASIPSLPYDVLPTREGTISASGSFTSPRRATVEMGHAMVDEMVRGLADIVRREFSWTPV